MWTPPLRELTPATSFGFDVVEFARDVVHRPLDPWQEWLVVHAGELLPDGRPRFRRIVVLVARQNGKTEVLVVLALYWQFVEGVPMVLGTSTKLDYARESWLKATTLAEGAEELEALRGPRRWKREANGEQESWTVEGARYKIAASNAEGGRSLTVHRLVLDELRQHHDYSAWGASVNAGNAVRDFQAWALSNAGDVRSVVLNDLRDAALAYLETGEGDPRLGLFEWSCEEDADPQDVHALAQANPNLGRRLDADGLLGEAAVAVRTGGEALSTFRTEVQCITVKLHNPAVDAGAWRRQAVPGDLSAVRRRVAVCLDVAPDQQHATLVAAAVLDDGRARVEPVKAWEGPGCTDAVARDLPALVARIRPQVFGWFPTGPAASLAADLAERKGPRRWPPPGVKVEAIKGDTAAVCMGFAEGVLGDRVVHADDPLLNAHVGLAQRLAQGDRWVFSRKGDGHCDAAYGAAGAVHLARTLPPPVGKPRLVVAE